MHIWVVILLVVFGFHLSPAFGNGPTEADAGDAVAPTVKAETGELGGQRVIDSKRSRKAKKRRKHRKHRRAKRHAKAHMKKHAKAREAASQPEE